MVRFVHGGVMPALTDRSIDELNEQASRMIKNGALKNPLLLSESSPLWSRVSMCQPRSAASLELQSTHLLH